MYKLLIVDDDEIICRGLGTCIDWNSNNIEVTGMVHDGEIALQCVEENKPDLIIVDINMPFMNGIEFSYIIRQNYKNIKIIMLTAYKEFEYAKKAIELQVFEYITKPLKNDEVLQAALRAIKSMQEEESYQLEVKKNMSLIREKYLSEIVLYGEIDDENYNCCGLVSAESYFQVAVLFLKYIYLGSKLEEELVNDEVAMRIATTKIKAFVQNCNGVSLFAENNKIVFVFEFHEEGHDREVQNYLTQVIQLLENDDNMFLSCGVGRIYQGRTELPLSYNEAKRAVEHRYNFGNLSTIFYKDLDKNSVEYDVKFPILSKKVYTAVEGGEVALIKENINNLFVSIQNTKNINISSVCFLALELILTSYKVVEDEELYEAFIKKSITIWTTLMKAKDIVDVEKVVEYSFEPLYQYFEIQTTDDLEKNVNKAMSYIQCNYDNPDLTLKHVADEVYLSSSYLCALIKKYKNISYVNYLNQVRMENAKRLLINGSVKTYEVAFLVGFNSSQYFSSCFKKYTGMTPGNYRSSKYNVKIDQVTQ